MCDAINASASTVAWWHPIWSIRISSSSRNPLASARDRKSTRLNSSHRTISYAVFSLPALHSFPTRRSSDLFMFGVQELATAAQFNIGVIVLVFNNNSYGNVRRDQRERFDGRVVASDLVNPDFVKLAESFGVGARSEEHTSELQSPYDLVCRLLPPRSTLFPYTTLFRSLHVRRAGTCYRGAVQYRRDRAGLQQ